MDKEMNAIFLVIFSISLLKDFFLLSIASLRWWQVLKNAISLGLQLLFAYFLIKFFVMPNFNIQFVPKDITPSAIQIIITLLPMVADIAIFIFYHLYRRHQLELMSNNAATHCTKESEEKRMENSEKQL